MTSSSGPVKKNAKSRVKTIWFFIIALCVIVGLIYFVNNNLSNKSRLENISDIKLPPLFIVLKNEYRDFTPHFQIIYEVKFDEKSSIELESSITKSSFYHKTEVRDDFSSRTVTQSENEKPIWFKTPYGYCFRFADNGKTYYDITFNTQTNVLLYEESSD
jgi:hypothetical protein